MSDSVKTATLFGETFKLEDEPSQFAMIEFGAVANEGLDDGSTEGLAALYNLVIGCVVPADQSRLKDTFRKNRATTDDMLTIVQRCAQGNERPTGLSSDSSDGQSSIEVKSDVRPDGRVSDIYDGRPDLQLAVSRVRSA